MQTRSLVILDSIVALAAVLLLLEIYINLWFDELCVIVLMTVVGRALIIKNQVFFRTRPSVVWYTIRALAPVLLLLKAYINLLFSELCFTLILTIVDRELNIKNQVSSVSQGSIGCHCFRHPSTTFWRPASCRPQRPWPSPSCCTRTNANLPSRRRMRTMWTLGECTGKGLHTNMDITFLLLVPIKIVYWRGGSVCHILWSNTCILDRGCKGNNPCNTNVTGRIRVIVAE